MGTQLNGRVALVTGASRGIGAGIATRLAADGAAVALTWSSSPDNAERVVKEITAAGGTAIAIQADAADEQQVRASVEQTVTAFGGLDVLVANAGIAGMKPVEQTTLADFDRVFAVNVRGVYAGVLAALPHLPEGGRIITVGSSVANRTPFPGGGVYTASKSALTGLVRALARDLGPRGITVNNVQPGPVGTDMNPADGPDSAAMHGVMALSGHGTPADVGSLVSYLAGPESRFITGASLDIDGGWSA
ncbi:3-oxoacyl-[acyl-carrier protein] reductase [Crossiella equi]|uniref:3-oxoacyl-[acyl-carrier protein] reductase n=1 Tax=Crossiella equi TaxID=130796 RepID=A0ABS5A943_9PSEU|nr:SDR family oxidoreductase [Crossiella equi]MBP2473085.1 3-oxoacyl-[acyl-carrier protein] reductase [Crossiella equi]